jgi:hypothetical protein
MRASMICSCLLVFFSFELIAFIPIVVSQDESVHVSSLNLYAGWSNELYVRYRVNIDMTSSKQNYSSVVVLVPFPTDKTLYCPDDVICAWQNVLNKITSIYLVIPPNHSSFFVEFQSAPMISSSSTGDERKFAIDFNFSDMSSGVEWLRTRNDTVTRFDEIQITFPFTTSMSSVDDTPSPSRVEGQSRVYAYDRIMTIGGTLTVRYPSPQSSWLLWGETALAGSVGFATAFVMYITTDDERLKNKRRAAWGTIVVLWLGIFILTPMWVFIGDWPWNIILPIWMSCVANTVVATSWIRILRRRTRTEVQTVGTEHVVPR